MINNVRLFEEHGVKYINLFSGFLHDGKYKPFLDYSLEIQTRANFSQTISRKFYVATMKKHMNI